MLRILGVNVDCKLTFESHLRAVAASAAQKLGIMRRAWSVFRDVDLIRRCFWSFILPVLEYCSPDWALAAESHLALLDRVVRNAAFMCPEIARCDLGHRRGVASLCMYYKIRENTAHPFNDWMPDIAVPTRHTRQAVASHRYCVSLHRVWTAQYGRSLVHRCSHLWNGLDSGVFDDGGLDGFKSRVNRFFLVT